MDPITALQIEVGAKPDGSFGPETVKKAMVHFNLSKSQTAHFFGQCAHESGGFTVFSENLKPELKNVTNSTSLSLIDLKL